MIDYQTDNYFHCICATGANAPPPPPPAVDVTIQIPISCNVRTPDACGTITYNAGHGNVCEGRLTCELTIQLYFAPVILANNSGGGGGRWPAFGRCELN
jgi:hypothetical protein